MLTDRLKPAFVRALLLCALACVWNPNLLSQTAAAPGSVLGTWKGESVCVAGNRPACKNEVVVYRFEAVAGKPGAVLLLADKLVGGRRDPMYQLEFQYDEAKGTLSSEFTRRQTHGLWQYAVSGDTLEGTLTILPSKELARRVKAERVAPDDRLPAAPERGAYEEN